MNTPSIYGLTLDQLEAWLLEKGQKKFRAQQIWDWLYIKRVLDFSEMTNLSKDLVALLSDNFLLQPLNKVVVQESADGTTKYLFQLEDKLMIETVLMRQLRAVRLRHDASRLRYRLHILRKRPETQTTRSDCRRNRRPDHADPTLLGSKRQR